MFDDLFNAGLVALIGAIGATSAASTIDAHAASTPPTRSIAPTQIVTLPAVTVIGRRASSGQGLKSSVNQPNYGG